MDTMKELAVNVGGMGAMQVLTTKKPLKDGKIPAGSDVVLTSGEDGVLYVTDLDSEEVVHDTVMSDGGIPSFAVLPDQSRVLLVSEEDNAVYSYHLPPAEQQMDALIVRSTVSIRQVVCSDKYIAVAEDDPKVRVVLRTNTDQVIAVEGADGAIKSVAIDPTDKFLSVSSEDGHVRVYELNDRALTATLVKSISVKHLDIRSEFVFARCAWQPQPGGQLLAVPVDEGIVELYDSSTWKPHTKLTLPRGGKSSDISILAFSPNGQYLAGATIAKEIHVWAIGDNSVVRSFRVDNEVLSVAWGNTQNTLVVYHTGGKFGFVKDVIPAGKTPPHFMGMIPSSVASSTASAEHSKTDRPKSVNPSSFIDDEAAGEHGGDDDETVEIEDDDNEARVEAIKASFGFGQAKADDDVDQDMEDPMVSQATTSGTYRGSTGAGSSPFDTPTEPFQPGNVQGDKGRSGVSLLAWTPAGEIESIRGANLSENLVKVEFVDKSRRGFKFNDNYLFTMGFLDDHGAIFGVPRRPREEWDDEVSGSEVISSYIFYRPFESWASNSSWHLALPEGEDAECVAAAQEFCAVATTLQCVRIYTTSGIEYALLRLPGRIVTITAKKSLLAVVFQGHHGQLQYQLLRIRVSSSHQRVELVTKGVLPLTPPPRDVFASHKENQVARGDLAQWSKLSWLGFDDRQILYSVDSFGCVQALTQSMGWNWFPLGCVGNTLNKKPDDRHGIFTLGIVNDSLLYFPLENGAKAPRLRGKHRPVPLTYALQFAAFPKSTAAQSGDAKSVNTMWQSVRLAGVETNVLKHCDPRDKDTVEDQVVHEKAEMDKSLILMMKAACTNDESARVLDLAKCLHLEKSHQIAQKLAVHYGLRQLQTQLFDLYQQRFEQLDEDSYSYAPPARHEARSTSSQQRSSARHIEVPRASREPLQMARNVLARPKAPPAAEYVEEELGSHEEPELESMSSPVKPASKTANPTSTPASIERSVAPANPFLKKPKASGEAGDDKDATVAGRKKSGLERLAKFASPPPKKRRGAWK